MEKANKKHLEEKIRKRVACEERAFRVVEKLVDNNISSAYLCDVAAYIDQSMYDDIVEERAIAKLCGYPICDKKISKVLQQKYHISTKTNNVYDITRRKRFCSGECYKASNYFANQISTSPVWSRGQEQPTEIKLQPRGTNVTDCIGDPLIENPRSQISQEIRKLEECDKNGDMMTKKDQEKKKSTSDRLDQPYSVINSEFVSKSSYIDRAVLYDYDYNQQVLKSTLNYEIVSKPCKSKCNKSCSRVINMTNNKSNVSNEEDNASSKDNISSKTDLLMDLLDKRQGSTDTLRNEHVPLAQENLDPILPKSLPTLSAVESVANHQVGTKLNHSRVLINIERANTQELSNNGQEQNLLDSDDDYEDKDGLEVDKSIKIQQTIDTIQTIKAMDELYVSESGIQNPQQCVSSSTERKKVDSLLEFINNILQDWKTPKTTKYLKLECQEDNNGRSNLDLPTLAEKVKDQIKHYSHLLEDDIHVWKGSKTTKPVPEYSDILKETDEYSRKVQNFYTVGNKSKQEKQSNKSELLSHSNQSESENKCEKKKQFNDNQVEISAYDRSQFLTDNQVSVPYIDSKSQVQLRRKIVIQKIITGLALILENLHLSIKDIAEELKTLVGTFNLTSENIILQPSEWNLVAYFIIELLALRNKTVQLSLKKKSSKPVYSIMLSTIGITQQQVKGIVQNLLHE